ncbi:MAG TPA: M15 family metallopeptidase [Pyrinomonadaceae bacterium]|nr:M15 family metallopeptidase [Pyrinomonadaceae bacterium]
MARLTLKFAVPLLCLILFSGAFAQNAPPKEQHKREAHLVELTSLDNTIKLDIRYATANNFVGRPVYPEARAFLQKPAANGVVKVHRKLKERGLGIVIFDGYRPWSITKLFWDVVADNQRKFVADPAKGSKHNRGCAVDLSVFDLKTGGLIDMPSGYDEFTERASPTYAGGTDKQRANRDMLRKLMEDVGFTVNPNEWWHFDYKNWQDYDIYDIAFSAVGNKK